VARGRLHETAQQAAYAAQQAAHKAAYPEDKATNGPRQTSNDTHLK
jgi:hypothetical protein